MLVSQSLVELACMDAIEKAVQGNLTVSAAMMMLDPSHFYIPLLILFNQFADSSDQAEGAILAETLKVMMLEQYCVHVLRTKSVFRCAESLARVVGKVGGLGNSSAKVDCR